MSDRQNKTKESYDGPEDAKKIDIAEPGEEFKPMYIASDLEPEEEWEDAGPIPQLESERAYLAMVNAEDCIKDMVTGCYLMQLQASIAMKTMSKAKKVKPFLKNSPRLRRMLII